MTKANPDDERLVDIATKSSNRVKRLYTGFVALFAIALVVCVPLGLWMSVGAVLRWIQTLESEVAAAVIAAAATSIAGFGAVVISQQRSKTREISEAHRPQKIDLYVRFIKKVMEVLWKHHDGKSGTVLIEDTNLLPFFREFTTDLVIWGSRGVIRAYAKFLVASREDGGQNSLVAMDDLLRAMRKDLGHSDWHLQRGELIKTFLTDPDELDQHL